VPILEYVDDSGRLITWDIVPAPRPRAATAEAAAGAHVWSCIISADKCSGVHVHTSASQAYAGALRHLGQARDHVPTGHKRGTT